VASLEALAAKRYVVVMDADPLVATFGRDGMRSAVARTRGRTLEAAQDAALRAVGKTPADKVYSYTVALNGFAADLTQAQAAKLAKVKGVQRVMHDVFRRKTTDASPGFLGLTGKGGVWAQGWTGEDVVVGVIDSGIWPEHPSFADDGSYGPSPVTLDPAAGPTCDFGNTAANPLDVPFTCNNKLLGARQSLATYRALIGADPDEYDSARDDDGHGTHTASTAAGNRGVRASIFGVDRGKVSGIAPRARVVAYKALGNLGGFGSDLAAAIDQAVADGVDVINYSIGGGPSISGPDDIAFLFAADAGVFVAASAGNDGPGAGTIGGPATVPWLTSVGASTQPRFFQGTLELGNGKEYAGASITRGTGKLPLVDAASAGSDVCEVGKLDPAKVAGAMVLCRRGVNGRAEKSFAVQQAGGTGDGALQQRQRRQPLHRQPRGAGRPPGQHPGPEGEELHRRCRQADRPDRRQAEVDLGVRAVDGDLLLAWPGPHLPGHHQAGRHRAGRADPGRQLADPRPGERDRRAVPGDRRHLDVQPARRRCVCADQAGAPGLERGGGQVGADDDCLPVRRRQRPHDQGRSVRDGVGSHRPRRPGGRRQPVRPRPGL
jgi:hypothetical protein